MTKNITFFNPCECRFLTPKMIALSNSFCNSLCFDAFGMVMKRYLALVFLGVRTYQVRLSYCKGLRCQVNCTTRVVLLHLISIAFYISE